MTVAGDLAELTFEIYMVAARLVARRADYILGQADLARDFYRERAAGLALLQFEQRTDVLHVEHHGAVGDAVGPRGVILYIRIVGRNDAVTTSLQQTFEDRFGYRAADHGFGARTELVD